MEIREVAGRMGNGLFKRTNLRRAQIEDRKRGRTKGGLFETASGVETAVQGF